MNRRFLPAFCVSGFELIWVDAKKCNFICNFVCINMDDVNLLNHLISITFLSHSCALAQSRTHALNLRKTEHETRTFKCRRHWQNRIERERIVDAIVAMRSKTVRIKKKIQTTTTNKKKMRRMSAIRSYKCTFLCVRRCVPHSRQL